MSRWTNESLARSPLELTARSLLMRYNGLDVRAGRSGMDEATVEYYDRNAGAWQQRQHSRDRIVLTCSGL